MEDLCVERMEWEFIVRQMCLSKEMHRMKTVGGGDTSMENIFISFISEEIMGIITTK